MMLRFNKELISPGKEFEAPKSQALLMIKNEFAVKAKKVQEPEVPEEVETDEIFYEDMTVKDLKSELEERGIDIPKKAVKNDLIELLVEDDENEDEIEYEDMTVEELKSECEKREIYIPEDIEKDDLVELLEEDDFENDEDDNE